MAELRVNPTRMELKKLKTRLATARRGHKLLKDKCDELMKRFLDVVREDRDLRCAVEEKLHGAYRGLSVAAATSDPRQMREALLLPRQNSTLTVGTQNVMSVLVPTFAVSLSGGTDGGSYGFAFTSGELDDAMDRMADMAGEMIRLAQLEKTAQLLSQEIERTRRRVNALEYIMIPQLEGGIRSITMKLEENERGNTTRLMKVKSMMVEAQMAAARAAEGREDAN